MTLKKIVILFLLVASLTPLSQVAKAEIRKTTSKPTANTSVAAVPAKTGEIDKIANAVKNKTPNFISKTILSVVTSLEKFRTSTEKSLTSRKIKIEAEIKILSDKEITDIKKSTTDSSVKPDYFSKLIKYVTLFFVYGFLSIFKYKVLFYLLFFTIVYNSIRFLLSRFF